jgi:curli biogenesis system outer membrane secretion channel CsgG
MKSVIFVVISLLLLTACAPSRPKPADEDQRPSLMVRADIRPLNQSKDDLRLGVLTLRDQRLSNFYGESDDFFRETVTSGLSQSAYLALKRSQLFSSTKRIVANLPDKLTRKHLKKIAKENGVDVLFIGDIVTFNLLRKSMMEADGLEMKMGGQAEAAVLSSDFQLSIDYQLIAQLIYAKDGSILWAEKVSRKKTVFADDGAIAVAALGKINQQVIRETMVDMFSLMNSTALRIK